MSGWSLGVISGLLAVLGWLGLVYLVDNTSPDAYTIPLFFILLFFALTTTFLPAASYLNHRFRRAEERPGRWRILRQSGWGALFFVLCTWLQLIRVLNWMVAVLLAGVFILIEAFILIRE
ncbi:MAG: hypothetical protein ACUVV0_06205 [Anaerolineae bacterium]